MVEVHTPAPLEAAPSTWSPSVLYLQPDHLQADPHTELMDHPRSRALNPQPRKLWDIMKLLAIWASQVFFFSGAGEGTCYAGCPSLLLSLFFRIPPSLSSSTGGPIQPEFPAA